MTQLPSKVVALHSPQCAIILQLQAVGEVLLVQGQQLVSVSYDRGVGWLETVLQGRHSELSALAVGSLGQGRLAWSMPPCEVARLGESHLAPRHDGKRSTDIAVPKQRLGNTHKPKRTRLPNLMQLRCWHALQCSCSPTKASSASQDLIA